MTDKVCRRIFNKDIRNYTKDNLEEMGIHIHLTLLKPLLDVLLGLLQLIFVVIQQHFSIVFEFV